MFDLGLQPDRIEDWCALARRQCGVASTLIANHHSNDAWGHAGFAAECALKAAVMRHRQFGSWPGKDAEPRLYSHSLQHLARQAGLDSALIAHEPIAPALAVVLLWRRTGSYNPREMPVRVAGDMVEAACGREGVIAWLSRRFQLTI